MATIQEIQARNAAQKAAQADGALPNPLDGIKKAPPGTVVAGMQSAASSADTVTAPPMEHELDEEMAKTAMAVYKDNGLRQYFPRDGSKRSAVKGYFYPTCDEHIGMLKHYASKGLVSKVTVEAE